MNIDKSNMRQMILNFPKQFRVGLASAKNIGIKNSELKIKNLVVCGMGGSALPGDILKIFFREHKINLPVKIHRGYGIPHYADQSHLVICISCSGNTEETLSAYETAMKNQLPVIGITSGGKLAQLCKKDETPLAVIPAGYPPRVAVGYQFAALMKILINFSLTKDISSDILNLEKTLQPLDLENQGKKLSQKLKNKLPIIYASDRLKELARIWKIKFNENSKIPAFSNCFPEFNHNELSGYENNRHPISIIILRDKTADHPRNLKRMELMGRIMEQRGASVDFIDITGKDSLSKVFSNILLADWASYYLALEYKVDPTPTKLNDEFKRRLK